MAATSKHHVVRPPGFSRVEGNKDQWLDPQGNPVDDASTLKRLSALRLPPAWTHVWVSQDPDAKLQATGVDSRGRTQYRYSAAAIERRQQHKYEVMFEFADALPDLRQAVASDFAAADGESTPDALTATAVRLLDCGLFRVGTEKYAKDNHTFGLTTLPRQDVTVDGDVMHFDFVGKEHIEHHMVLTDADAARVLQHRLAQSGADDELLFRSASPEAHVSSASVNSYIHKNLGVGATAKTFRTWGATVAAAAVAGGAECAGMPPHKRADLVPIQAAATLLGDTLAVARNSYVHPAAAKVGAGSVVRDAVDAAADNAGSRDIHDILDDEDLRAAVVSELKADGAS